jgi:23S rRNA (pseudouridine1915-N3)-methyltransferase
LKLVVVSVGAASKGAEQDLAAEYLARIGRYCTVSAVEVKPGRDEAAAIAKACAGATIVALDERGTTLAGSEKFARRLESLASRGKGIVAFVIGGAHGLPPATRTAAHEIWSLSPLTFPHRLARAILCEQLYRALTILRGEPYHH